MDAKFLLDKKIKIKIKKGKKESKIRFYYRTFPKLLKYTFATCLSIIGFD